MQIFSFLVRVLVVSLALALAGCGKTEPPQAGAYGNKTAKPGADKPAEQGKKDGSSPPKEAGGHAEKGGEEHEGELTLSEAEMKAAGITVEVIRPQQVAGQLMLTANIAANQDRLAHVAPRIQGRIIKVMASLGDRVKAGQALAVIDSVEMGEARADYRRAQSELKLAEATYQRTDGLYREQVVPQRQWLEVKSAYERAQASAEAATDKLRMLGGLPDTGQSSFVVIAPFAGVIIEKKAVLGELARPEDGLFTVADLSTVWIEADVAEKDVEKLTVGARATVTLAAFPDETFKGRVSYISHVFDKQTRTLKARIEVPNPDNKLRLDMFARVAVAHTDTHEALVLPQDAVVMVQGESVVYVVDEDGIEPKPVQIGERLPGRVVIASGLKAGEKVVTGGAYELKSRQLKSQLGDEH